MNGKTGSLALGALLALLASGPAHGKDDPPEDVVVFQDFESADVLQETVVGRNLQVERVAGAEKDPGSVLRGRIPKAQPWADLLVQGVPKDVRPFRLLRFRLRLVLGPKDTTWIVRFGSGREDTL